MAKATQQNFEEALEALEKIVGELEGNEDLPLDKAIALYERGMHLSTLCQKKLEEAHQKIVKVQENANGELTESPLPQQEASLFDIPAGPDEEIPF